MDHDPIVELETELKREFDEQLINAVQQFPCLYDPSYREYRDVGRTAAAWLEAAKLCGKAEPTQCKERWRKLRDAYVKVNKKMVVGAIKQHTNWPYYEMMSFLEDFIKHRESKKPNSRGGGKRQKQVEPHPVHLSTSEHEASESNSQPKRLSWVDDTGSPKAKKTRPADTIEIALLESLGQSATKYQTADVAIDDEEGLFGKMVAATLRRFPPRAKALCKFKIQEIIFEQENQNLTSDALNGP